MTQPLHPHYVNIIIIRSVDTTSNVFISVLLLKIGLYLTTIQKIVHKLGIMGNEKYHCENEVF